MANRNQSGASLTPTYTTSNALKPYNYTGSFSYTRLLRRPR